MALLMQSRRYYLPSTRWTDEGEVKWYLGMEINRLPDGALLLTQTKYIRDLLARHGMEKCARVLTPMTEVKLEKAPEGFTTHPKELKEYQTLLGELMHLMVQTHPDIAYAVSRLAQFMSNPTNEHWLEELGICYNRSIGNLTMEVWSDASWGEDPDDSRSTTGYVVLMAGGPVAWKSTKQQSVALSSTEAEYIARTAAATSVMRTRGLLKELQIKGAIPTHATLIYADNQGAIGLANNPTFQKRSKHINIRYHYARDLVKQGEIELIDKRTQDMIADGLTKPLGPIKFAQFVESLGLLTVKSARSEGTTD